MIARHRLRLSTFTMLVLLAALAASSATPAPSVELRLMIRDGRRIVAESGDIVWPGIGTVTLPIDLIENDREILFCGRHAPGFTPAAIDPVTGCGMQWRKRELPVDLAAASTMGDQPLIQMGLPGTLELSRAQWIVTLLHESFHQYQASLPGYQAAVDAIGVDLDKPGSGWFLSYPFPYARHDVVAAFARMNRCARAFLANKSPAKARQLASDYVTARREAEAVVGARDWRYYEFQVGQEGVARWYELRLARSAGRRDRAIAAVATDKWGGLVTSLRATEAQGLNIWKRNALYVFGAVEAEMLDQTAPD